jgi:ABC-type arginine transport system permease subunit
MPQRERVRERERYKFSVGVFLLDCNFFAQSDTATCCAMRILWAVIGVAICTQAFNAAMAAVPNGREEGMLLNGLSNLHLFITFYLDHKRI